MVHNANDQIDAFEDAARLVSLKGLTRFTRFLDPAQVVIAERIAHSQGVRFSSWGGYPDAERVVGCFHPYEEDVESNDFPLVCLHARINPRFNSVTHRDLLGAFMALGLTRACIGDMIISEKDVYLFSMSQTSEFVAGALTSAGKTPLSFSVLDCIPDMPEPAGSAFSAVVSSLRLDAVLAAAYRLSRSEASEVIREGLVKVNHIPCERTDYQVKEGALLSLRGKGRVRLSNIQGLTKKQRIGISLFRYE